MNIKITKEESDYILNNHFIHKFTIGSRLYGTNKDNSDTDILVLYNSFHESDVFYPNYHQFQYDDVDNNTQYIFTSEPQFFKNLYSGDSSINADIVMFCSNLNEEVILNKVRTYNIIKGFIGFAKRDLKRIDKGKNKVFHAERSLYCAEMLLDYEVPKLEEIKNIYNNPKTLDDLKYREEYFRKKCNDLFDSGCLTLFPKIPIYKAKTTLEEKLINANNIKQFKY